MALVVAVKSDGIIAPSASMRNRDVRSYLEFNQPIFHRLLRCFSIPEEE